MAIELKDHYWLMKPNKPIALQFAKRQISEFVFDAANLEGINYSLPEIQTLLSGVSIGGHKLSDQNMVLNQAEAWKKLFKLVEKDEFILSSNVACIIHSIAAKDEALKWGSFRDGKVFITGTNYTPPDHFKLTELFEYMVNDANDINDIYERSFAVFLSMSRNQFFYDVNKRTGRFMMNGILLNHGYPAINLPAKRQAEFNTKMIDFYNSGNMKPMNEFLRSCMDPRVVEVFKVGN